MVLRWLDRFQRRHRSVALTMATVYKFVEDEGFYLASVLAYAWVVSLFPALLLLVTLLGYALQDNPALQQQILDSALVQIPVIGELIGQNISSLRGSGAGLVVGALGALLGALNVAGAGQSVMNKLWAVPKVRRPNVLGFYARSLLLLALLGFGVLLSTALTALTTAASSHGAADLLVRIGGTLAAIVLNLVLFLPAFRILTARTLTIQQLWPGAVLAAVVWQLAQAAGTYLISHMLAGADATYGLFAILLGLLAWTYAGATIIVLCTELNTVRVLGLAPRSLLTQLTGQEPLTDADRRAFTVYVTTEQRLPRPRIWVGFPRLRRGRRAPEQHPDREEP